MTRSGRAWAVMPPAWYVTPPYYKDNPDAVFGPEDPIPFPYYTGKLDLDPEIGSVIGCGGRNLSIEEAAEHIAGYTIFINASCRKSGWRATPGTCAPSNHVTSRLRLRPRNPPHPGDVIGTGTVGLGCSMDPHRWPQVGRIATIKVQGIARQTHRIVEGERVVSHVLGMPGLLKHKPA